MIALALAMLFFELLDLRMCQVVVEGGGFGDCGADPSANATWRQTPSQPSATSTWGYCSKTSSSNAPLETGARSARPKSKVKKIPCVVAACQQFENCSVTSRRKAHGEGSKDFKTTIKHSLQNLWPPRSLRLSFWPNSGATSGSCAQNRLQLPTSHQAQQIHRSDHAPYA